MLSSLPFIRVLLVGGMVAIVPLSPVYAQVLPQGWGAIGSKEGQVSYAIGARWLDFGVELGRTRQGATGVDVLKFIPLPIISPYAGIGVYSADESLAYSAGAQVRPQGTSWFFGAGYHSVRGVNGQFGLKF